jgi:hypothetical protein
MARGTAIGERVVSQANTPGFRDGYARTFGDSKPQRGRWIWDAEQGRLVSAEQYRPTPRAVDAPIIADRIHEGTAWDDGERVRDLGCRRKRREFLRETGLSERSDYGPGWRERTQAQRGRDADRRADGAFDQAARKLYSQGKLRE